MKFDDFYWGHRGSGGSSVVQINGQTVLLIHFNGGETTRVPDEEVSLVNAHLKEALREKPKARSCGTDYVVYESGSYFYIGTGIGDIWTLDWVELIGRTGQVEISRLLFALTKVNDLRNCIQDDPEWLLFHHQLTHQRIV